MSAEKPTDEIPADAWLTPEVDEMISNFENIHFLDDKKPVAREPSWDDDDFDPADAVPVEPVKVEEVASKEEVSDSDEAVPAAEGEIVDDEINEEELSSEPQYTWGKKKSPAQLARDRRQELKKRWLQLRRSAGPNRDITLEAKKLYDQACPKRQRSSQARLYCSRSEMAEASMEDRNGFY